MKRYISVILTLVLIFSLGTSMAAYAQDYLYVYDNAGLLSPSEKNILEYRCEGIADEDFTVVFYTENKDGTNFNDVLAGLNPELSYGDGLIFYKNKQTGRISLYPLGSVAEKLSQETVQQLVNIAGDKAEEISFYKGCQSIVENVERIQNGLAMTESNVFRVSVFDYTDTLSEDELDTLTDKFDALREKHGVDVAAYIDEEMWLDTAMESADDLYDYYFYGIGKDDDGILLYISKDPREYWFTTHGLCEEYFTDNGIEYLKSSVLPYLKENNYYEALSAYADAADELLTMAESGEIYDKKPPKKMAMPIFIGILISAVIAFIAMSVQVSKMKTANKQMYAENYVQPGSMNVTDSKDLFMYSHVTRTQKESSSSSGGSSHTSSSGRSHGGGGGSY